MSPRSAVIIGGLVVALFVVVVVIGVGQGDGSSEDSNSFVDALSGLVADPATVALDDIEVVTVGCVDEDEPHVLGFGGTLASTCTLRVERDGGLGLVRVLPLSDFRVAAPAPEGDLRVRLDAEPGEEVTVAVGEGTTDIELFCLIGSCTAELVE